MLPTRPRRRKRERVIRSSTVRAMLAQAHFKFKQLLRYKLARVGGRLVDCEEKTSKPCSSCGTVNNAIGGDRVFRCSACHVRLDRDVNVARTQHLYQEPRDTGLAVASFSRCSGAPQPRPSVSFGRGRLAGHFVCFAVVLLAICE
jgi:transposase